MAKKTTIKTEEVIQEPAETAEPILTQPEIEDVSQGDLELLEYFDRIQANSNKVNIYKMIDGRKNFCGSAEPSLITEEYLLRNYGGGKYILLALKNNKFVERGNRELMIYEPPFNPNEKKEAPDARPRDYSEVSAIREAMNRQHELMLQMIQNMSNAKKPDISLQDIILLMKESGAPAKGPDLLALLPQVMDIITKAMEMGKEAGRETAGGESWLSIAKDGIKALPGVVSDIVAARRGNGAPVQENPAADEFLRHGLALLKQKAMKNAAPDLYAELILDNMDDPSYQPVAMALMNKSFEDFCAIDPEIGKEPLRTWFQNLYNAIREGIDENSKIAAGAGGGASDTSGNDATHD